MIECMIVSKRDSSRCELNIENDKIKQVNKFNSLGNVMTENVTQKCEAYKNF